MDRSTKALLLSLILHALLWWAIDWLPSASGGRSGPTEVVFLDGKNESTRKRTKRDPREQYHDQQPAKPDAKTDVDDVHDVAPLKSDRTRRHPKQSLSRQTGSRVNAQSPSLQPSLLQPTPPQPQTSANEPRERPREPGKELILPNSLGAKPRPLVGGSSGSLPVPWVDFGDATVLNSDRDTFYVFYSRMLEQVGNRWGRLLNEMISRMPREQLMKMAENDRRFIVEIVLDRHGDFVRFEYKQGSNFKDLDYTGVEAFRMATPFVNPPKELPGSDGLIHTVVAFTVLFRPPSMIVPSFGH